MRPPNTRPLPAVEHLRVDPTRRRPADQCIGYFTPAFDENGHTCTAGIEELDRRSLAQWLRTRTSREFVESVVGRLLGHGQMHESTDGFVNRGDSFETPDVDKVERWGG